MRWKAKGRSLVLVGKASVDRALAVSGTDKVSVDKDVAVSGTGRVVVARRVLLAVCAPTSSVWTSAHC